MQGSENGYISGILAQIFTNPGREERDFASSPVCHSHWQLEGPLISCAWESHLESLSPSPGQAGKGNLAPVVCSKRTCSWLSFAHY